VCLPICDLLCESGRCSLPRAQNGELRNSKAWIRPEGEPQNLENFVGRYPEVGLWPTPLASNGTGAGQRWKGRSAGQDNLDERIARLEMFKTPTAAPFSHGGSGGELHKQIAPNGGPLNPTWVEWLMGFPLGWTDLPASETPSSRKSSRKSDA
jgi:hypothetical protein